MKSSIEELEYKLSVETDSAKKAYLHKDLASLLWNTGSYELSRIHSNYSLELASILEDKELLFQSYQNIGISYSVQGNQDEAQEFFNICLGLAHKTGNKRHFISSCINLGNVNYHISQYEKALDFYLKALSESHNSQIDDHISKLYNNIGNVLLELKDYDEALAYLKQSLIDKLKNNDKVGSANCMVNIGSAYIGLKDYSLCLAYYKKALKIYKEFNSVHNIALTCFNIGFEYSNKNKCDKAIEYLNVAIEYSFKYDLKSIKNQSYAILASIYEKQDKLDLAEEYYNVCLNEIDDISDKKSILYLYSKYAGFLKKINKHEQAVLYLEKYIKLNQDLFSEEMKKNVAVLKSTINYEQKKYEAEIYRLKNVELLNTQNEIEMQKAELIQLNKSKDSILAIVSHDLKNSIGSILTVSELFDTEDLTPKLKKFIEIIKSQGIKALNLVKDILDANRIDMDSYKLVLSRINVNDLLRSYESMIIELASAKNLKIVFNYEENELFCHLNNDKFWQIIHNLISNAIKFSYPNSTIELHTKLNLELEQAHADIIITDHGIGIDESMQELIFEKFSRAGKKGTLGEESTGLGLSIVKRLITLHDAKITLKSQLNKGSSFVLSFPLSLD